MRLAALARIAPVAFLCLVAAGCQTLGPASLRAGRAGYNDVIARTDSEQTLGLIVRLRYGDPLGLLAVSSVTASLRFSAKAEGQAGIGPQSSYAGNLVPFSAGVGYEDSPTISYVPVDAQAFLGEWLEPESLDMVLGALQFQHDLQLFTLLVARMNDLRSGLEASPAERAAFDRAVALLGELADLGAATWIAPAERPGRYELVLSQYAPAHTAQVEELLALLDLPAAARRGATIRIPVELRPRTDDFKGLAMQTRSVGAILRGASETVEVPEEHVTAGVVAASPVAPAYLRIRSSRDAPSQASVAVEHRGWWYYVDDTDLASKHAFLQIQLLFQSRLAQARGAQKAPVLTLPVK